MLIGILMTGHPAPGIVPDGRAYDHLFAGFLDGQGFSFQGWSVVDMDFPEGPDAADGWLITGSRHGAYEDLPFIAPLEGFVRDILEAGKPLVGVCFGHQIIAQALGGRVEKWPGGWKIGLQEYDWGEEAVALNAWHQDQVTRVPQGARTLANGPDCAHAALLYRDGPAFSVQAHPEFGSVEIGTLLETRGRGVVPDEILQDAGTRLDRPNDNARLARTIGHFLREGRLP